MKKLFTVAVLCILAAAGKCYAGPNAVYSPECDSFGVKQSDITDAVVACHAQGGTLTVERQPSPLDPALLCPVSWTCE